MGVEGEEEGFDGGGGGRGGNLMEGEGLGRKPNSCPEDCGLYAR